MTAHGTPLRVARAASLLSMPALVFVLSTSAADAHPARLYKHGHGYGRGYGHARVVRVAAPYGAVRDVFVRPQVVVVRRAYAPFRAYAPCPVYAAPLPYGSVVYDRGHGSVDAYVGISGPNFSFGIAF